jgi:hypothetical protein
MTGRCFCGNVVFEFDGPITDIEICHCSRCQLAAKASVTERHRSVNRSRVGGGGPIGGVEECSG